MVVAVVQELEESAAERTRSRALAILEARAVES